jgi:hypothetical protein
MELVGCLDDEPKTDMGRNMSNTLKPQTKMQAFIQRCKAEGLGGLDSDSVTLNKPLWDEVNVSKDHEDERHVVSLPAGDDFVIGLYRCSFGKNFQTASRLQDEPLRLVENRSVHRQH